MNKASPFFDPRFSTIPHCRREFDPDADLARRLSGRRVLLVLWSCPEALREPLKRLVARAAR